MKTTARLEALEADLTPKQFICKLMDEVNASPSISAYSLRGSKSGEWAKAQGQLESLFENLGKKWKAAKLSPEAISKKRKTAQMSFSFLLDLYIHTFQFICNEKYKFAYKGLAFNYAASQLAHALKDVGYEKNGKTQALMKKTASLGNHHLCNFYGQKYALEQISQDYFEGRDILHPEDRQWFEHLLDSAEQIAEAFNEWLEIVPSFQVLKKDWAINLPDIQKMAHREQGNLVDSYINLAKISVWTESNQRDKAMDLIHLEILKWTD